MSMKVGDRATAPQHGTPSSQHPTHNREIGCGRLQGPPQPSVFNRLGLLDRFLAIWILLAMTLGILLGNFVNGIGDTLRKGQFVDVSIPIAVGLLVMMYPILCKVQYERLHHLFRSRAIWYHLLISVVINWIVAPLVMLGLAWAFLPDQPHLRQGLILVGIARCIAMVLIWNGLAGGDGDYCAILVAVNSLLQILLTAPVALLFIKVANPHFARDNAARGGRFDLHYETVARSVAVFLGIPLAAAVLTRVALIRLAGRDFFLRRFIPLISPLSLLGLLFTIVVLFASQGRRVVQQIVSVVRVAAPLVVYFAIMFFSTLAFCMFAIPRSQRSVSPSNPAAADVEKSHSSSPVAVAQSAPDGNGYSHEVQGSSAFATSTTTDAAPINTSTNMSLGRYEIATTQAFTAASNNFELAIAVAVASFGANSDEALAATVGPLIEVPVLLALVYVVRWIGRRRGWTS